MSSEFASSGRTFAKSRSTLPVFAVGVLIAIASTAIAQGGPENGAGTSAAGSDQGYAELVKLFHDWRAFERPNSRQGAPDYTAESMARRHQESKAYRARLDAIDPSAWSIEQQVDHHLVRAEMNGFDFNYRVLRPWARDPAFYASVWTYQSDTPEHEGPMHHAPIELWTYDFPLSSEAEAELEAELRTVAPLLDQARLNLVGNARELWLSGIDNIRDQVADLDRLKSGTSKTSESFRRALDSAREASADFVTWLEQQAPSKTEPSGIGKENYTWYLQNVHLVPLSWEDEVRLLQRELARAHASLALEEHRNRNLPPLDAASSPEEYERLAHGTIDRYLDFLEKQEIMDIHPFMDPALRARIGGFVPEESRNFFRKIMHLDPTPLWAHFYHWWDLARMQEIPHPSPIRRGPLLYNIFDSRSEGLTTGVEELLMHAGLYDQHPRSRELVWIMVAQRAARGLGSLYVHSNRFTMKEARDFHVARTPEGWMREDLDLLGFEQQLYLRQPGYGTSYISGKYLIERLLSERRQQLGGDFTLSGFFREVDAAGVIPVSLIHWQLTGQNDEIRALLAAENTPMGGATVVP